jgi:hypothetical protein
MQAQSDLQSFIFDTIVVIFILAIALFKIMRQRSADNFMDGPILSSADMLGAGGLQALSQGELSGFKYNLLTNNKGRVMVSVQIGHFTGTHIVAFGDKSRLGGAVKQAISKKWLTAVELEGDFPDYFRLYCSPAKQMELREFFNPKTMLQFVEFCRAYDFEIFDETLFISQAQGAEDAADQTTLTADVESFLQENAQVLTRL